MATNVSSNPISNLKRDYRRVESDVELVADTIIIDGLDPEMVHGAVGVKFFADALGAVPAVPGAGTVEVTVETVNSETPVTATGVLTIASLNANDLETVTIDGKVYTFDDTTLDDVDGHVLIGANAGASLDNLIAAINLGAGAGSTYATSTTLHPTVTALAGAGDTLDARAKTGGLAGNSIATTETMATASWGDGTLTGGLTGTFETVGASTITAATPTTPSWNLSVRRVQLVPAGVTVATHYKAVWSGSRT